MLLLGLRTGPDRGRHRADRDAVDAGHHGLPRPAAGADEPRHAGDRAGPARRQRDRRGGGLQDADLAEGTDRDEALERTGSRAVAAAPLLDADDDPRLPAADARRARGGRVHALDLRRHRDHAVGLLAAGHDRDADPVAPLRRGPTTRTRSAR